MPVEQGWALIGLIGVFIVAFVTLVTLNQRNLKSYLDAKFDAVDVKIAAVNERLDRLDRDVQTLFNHIFRNRPD
jgi:beta-lactamase regulating signal transducer with metallopeptidase domain